MTTLNIPWTKYIRVEPSDRQMAFCMAKEMEVLFGGAAGGGKTYAELMAGLQYVGTPGYSALLLRRSYTDLALSGAWLDIGQQWLRGSDAKWRDTEKTWVFPSGATLTFGYLATEDDKYRYQSSQYQYICFDELSQFTETQYTYMFSRLRKPDSLDVPLRMRAGTNPDGPGLEWVRQRFIIDKRKGRLFIPSLLDDNPYIDKESYVRSMQELDPITRKRLLEGDWYAVDQGNRAFGIEALTAMREYVREPIDTLGLAQIWRRYQPGRRYGAGTDTSHGVGADDAVTVITDLDDGYDVACIRSSVISPETLAEESYKLLEVYGFPLWAIEDNEWGISTIKMAQQLGYPNLFHRVVNPKREPLPGKVPAKIVGWHTDETTRYTLWSEAQSAVEAMAWTVPSKAGLEQFFTVIRNPSKGGRIEAMEGAKDDYPIAKSIAWQMRKYATHRPGKARSRGVVALRMW